MVGFGGEIRYQARWMAQQLLVPMGGYQVESIRYRLHGIGDGNLLVHGPFAGLMLNLSRLEPSALVDGYRTSGIRRTYLLSEVRLLQGKNETFRFDGRSFFFGLRFEI
jgi:hypothetical protein